LTIIALGKDYWIETLVGTFTTSAAAAVETDSETLERSGIFLGGTVILDTVSANSEFYQGINLRGNGGIFLGIGTAITGIQMSVFQNDATSRSLGWLALVLMRAV